METRGPTSLSFLGIMDPHDNSWSSYLLDDVIFYFCLPVPPQLSPHPPLFPYGWLAVTWVRLCLIVAPQKKKNPA